VTWRVVAALLVLAGVIGGFFYILHWYAYSTYYLGNDNGTVAVYRGQPSGVLWYKPLVVQDTSVSLSGLRLADQQLVLATIAEPSVKDALTHIVALHAAYCLSASCPTTTTTTIAGSTVTTTTTSAGSIVTTTTAKKG
jgi:hypothetical protein